jgi:lipid II:glycine glycyltransferase (peptidoglycan interpeptide bridge formation enzyme)
VVGDKEPIFFVYNGIIFSSLVSKIKKISTKNSIQIILTNKIIDFLIKKHKKINFTLHPNFEDLRPFQWYNYNENSKNYFNIKLNYTAILDIKKTEEELLNNFRTVRKQEYKKYYNLVSNEGTVDDLIDLYKMTFDRQKITLDKYFLHELKHFCRYALNNKFAKMFFLKENSTFISSTFFLFDENTAYYLIGASNPYLRKKIPSTPLLVNNIFEFKKNGITKIDFIGINSPKRGDFKMSFSPQIKAYYNVSSDSLN